MDRDAETLEQIETEDGFTDRDEPRSSAHVLEAIQHAEKKFEKWQSTADRVDKIYSKLARTAGSAEAASDKDFALFWANVEVLKPSIYSRPPIPVVVPKFKDRRPLYRTASEVLERSSVVAFDLSCIDDVMLGLRDDLAIVGRGASWVRYETKEESDGHASDASAHIVIEHLDRKDFLHQPARSWAEVQWVARRGWMTRKQMRERFHESSGSAYQEANFSKGHDSRDGNRDGGADERERAGVWEVWSKAENRVFWVSEGVDVFLDGGDPHLDLEGFFPCPKPAYATLQRGTLIPVPDMLYYETQLDEINELTRRINALSQSIRVKGFYPKGAGEAGDAIESAIADDDDRMLLVPMGNWAALSNSSGKIIEWLPTDMIAATVTQLVTLRSQIIEDVYQIMGLSDIMRGSTQASETLGAQQLKAQYGSVRVRDKIEALVRVARDLVRISAEIMAEEFSQQTLLDMSQMQLPTDADIRRQVQEMRQQARQQAEQQAQAQIQEMMADPQIAQQAEADPQGAQQAARQFVEQAVAQATEALSPRIEAMDEIPTIEKVVEFLRDQHIRPFVLDIESDSTIQPDEDAEKQRRQEFLVALNGTIAQVGPMMQAGMASLAGEIIKFAIAPYRAGRELEGAIDEAIEAAIQQAGQQEDPEAEARAQEAQDEQQKAEADAQLKQAEMEMRQQESQAKIAADQQRAEADAMKAQSEARARQQEAQARIAQIQAQTERDAARAQIEAEKGQLEVEKLRLEIAARGQDAAIRREEADQMNGGGV